MYDQQPPEWLQVLFSRLGVSYGQEWRTMWAGLDPLAVMRDWYAKLHLVQARNPGAIRYALDNLPDRVPTADKFRALCMNAPNEQKILSAPVAKPAPEFAAQVYERLQKAKPATRMSLGQECAQRLEAKVARGERLSRPQQAQLDAIRSMGGAQGLPA